MSSIERILKAVREVLLLTSDVEKMAEEVKELAKEVRDHDRRLIRIETMIEMARPAARTPGDREEAPVRADPPRLERAGRQRASEARLAGRPPRRRVREEPSEFSADPSDPEPD